MEGFPAASSRRARPLISRRERPGLEAVEEVVWPPIILLETLQEWEGGCGRGWGSASGDAERRAFVPSWRGNHASAAACQCQGSRKLPVINYSARQLFNWTFPSEGSSWKGSLRHRCDPASGCLTGRFSCHTERYCSSAVLVGDFRRSLLTKQRKDRRNPYPYKTAGLLLRSCPVVDRKSRDTTTLPRRVKGGRVHIPRLPRSLHSCRLHHLGSICSGISLNCRERRLRIRTEYSDALLHHWSGCHVGEELRSSVLLLSLARGGAGEY